MEQVRKMMLALVAANVRMEHIQYERLEGNQHIQLSNKEGGCLVLVASGEGMLVNGAGGSRQMLRRGSFFINLQGIDAVVHAADEEAIGLYELVFQHDLLQVDSTASCYQAELSKRAIGPLIDRMKELYVNRLNQGELERFRLHIDFQELLYSLFEDAEEKRDLSHAEALLRTACYMERNFHEPLSRDKMAEMAGMSAPYYSRAFKKQLGKTPQEYWTGVRLNHARKALIQGKDKMSEIAEYTGFGEPYYFSRVFKNVLGVSPTVYQKQPRQRVVCLYPPFIDCMLALGVVPSAVMIDSAHPLSGRLDGSLHLGSSETELGVREASLLEEQQPELILCSDYIHPDQELLLSRIAPTVAVTWRRERRTDLLEIAGLLGRSEAAVKLLEELDQQLDQAREQLSRSLGRASVAMLRFHAQQMRLYGGPKQGFVGPILYRDLNLQPPLLVQQLTWDKWWASLEPSLLPALDAEHLLIVIDPGMEEEAGLMMSGEIWAELAAVRKGQVYLADYYTWMSSGMEMDKLKIAEALRLFATNS
ncbi:AraC family transcriptional regulator [Paenibacillus sp. KS-LC4]|uniref:AraC family transcriptional regulator n=1 Tax=Paenibacillus sp. KS-LC4 TaxID=2979727 RepID=UPI0030CEBDFB